MSEKPRVLLVGAGAVGQVFGKYLSASGCDLAFLVKEKHAPETRKGFTLYAWGLRGGVPRAEKLTGFDVHVTMREVAERHWDQVWLCVSSTALREGDWVRELARATGEATWVMLQPALDDREWLLKWIPEERLVSGMIPFLSYTAPLEPGERISEPGTAFWFPPLARGLFSGPRERLGFVMRGLKAGGYPARETGDVRRAAAMASAVLTAGVEGLDAAGWSFERLLGREHLERMVSAAREAVQVAAWSTQGKASTVLPVLRPGLLRFLLPIARRATPMNLETYLRVHFTKVKEQTRQMTRTYIETGEERGPAG